jgi:hypothetical protein
VKGMRAESLDGLGYEDEHKFVVEDVNVKAGFVKI